MTIVGVTDWCLDEQGCAAMGECAAIGFGALQIGIASEAAGQKLASTQWQREARAEADKQGIALAGIALNVLELHGTGESRPDSARIRALRLVRDAARAAGQLGSTLVYVPAFGKNRIDGKDAIEREADFLLSACRIGADHGVAVASENTLGVEDNLRLVAAVAHPSFRILIDTYNPRLWGHNARELIIALRHSLADQAHVKDGIGGAMGLAALGGGEGEAMAALDAFSSIEYQGTIFLENDYRGANRSRARKDIHFVREHFTPGSVRQITPIRS